MLLVPPKEGFHFGAVRTEECGLSEKQMKTRDKSGFEEKNIWIIKSGI